jgi:hypothetical protein
MAGLGKQSGESGHLNPNRLRTDFRMMVLRQSREGVSSGPSVQSETLRLGSMADELSYEDEEAR